MAASRVQTRFVSLVKISTLGVALLCAAACAKHQERLDLGSLPPSIVNGQPVQPQEDAAHSTVALYLDMSISGDIIPFQNVCTGTLIAPDVVLTAAHCFVDLSHSLTKGLQAEINPDDVARAFRIGFGLPIVNSRTDAQVQFRSVSRYVVHPQYVYNSVKQADRVPMFDLALIQLDSPAPASFHPAPLVRDARVLKKGTNVLLAGYGALGIVHNKDIDATQLMETEVKVDNPTYSPTQWTYLVAQDGKGSCSGDSGGPAYVHLSGNSYALVGVTSWGDETCRQIGAYTSVPAFANWIDSVTNSWRGAFGLGLQQ